MYVIEEKPKIFELTKKILRVKNEENNIFLYGDADFSFDIKKYLADNNALIFKFAPTEKTGKPDIDLAVLGEYKNNLDLSAFGNIGAVLMNIENSRGLNSPGKNTQIITCGLKQKSTAVFSSINLDEGTVILDLQRSVKNIYGETLEPFEKQIFIPEAVRKESSEDLILSLTALVFCGRL